MTTLRQHLHRRLLKRYDPVELAIFTQAWCLRRGKWINRYCDWSVARFGEKRGEQPWWDVAIGKFICWLSDWRTTLALWFGRNEVPS